MNRYTCRFRVRQHELDAFNHLNNVVYVQYMQEAAIGASTAVGFGPDWYRAQGAGWVIRRLAIRYLAQATYGDEIEVATWISRGRAASASREYELTRVGDGARVARARAEWVYIDLEKREPTRFPPEFAAAFAPTGETEDLGVRMPKAQETSGAHRYRSRRRVQFHELDISQHVNHAFYLQWIGQAYFDVLHAIDYPPEKSRRQGWLVFQGGHEIDYFGPALDNDEIEIVSWICELGKVRGAWTYEIYNVATGKLLARDYSLGVFVTPDGKPKPLPDEVIETVLRGPTKNA